MCAGEVSNLWEGSTPGHFDWLEIVRGYCLCLVGKIVAKHFRVAVLVASHADVLLARHVILTKERVTKP